MPLTPTWLLGLLAMLAYSAASWPAAPGRRWPDVALALGWLAHGAALVIDVTGLTEPVPGARFGFGPALSATVWIVISSL